MPDQAQGLRALADQSRHQCAAPAPSVAQRGEDLKADLPICLIAPPEGSLSLPAMQRAKSGAQAPDPEAVARRTEKEPGVRRARVVAVTSGKGGVGKTSFACNLALVLAGSGQRVILIDADLGLANAHLVMGIRPHVPMAQVMCGERSLREALFPAQCGVRVLGGGSDIADLAKLDVRRRKAFFEEMRQLDELADVLLIDTGAGISENVTAFLAAVEEILVISTPEPTAAADAYATIKVITRENPGARLRLLMNRTRSASEAQRMAEKLLLTARQFLKVEIEYAGCVPEDPAVPDAVRARRPFVLASGSCAAAQSLARIAARLGLTGGEHWETRGIAGFLDRVEEFAGANS